MHVISKKALADFVQEHRIDSTPFDNWYKIVSKGEYQNFAELKQSFNSVDVVGDFHVFDIAGNKYRIIAAIHFNRKKLYIRHVFTHSEYDKWSP